MKKEFNLKEKKILRLGKDIELNLLSEEEQLNKKDIKDINNFINSQEIN